VRLTSFQVRVYRNVIDSGVIAADAVTCLVGKNEAGKSALLQALHCLNPAKPEQELDLLEDYPRWLRKQHEITGEIAEATPIEAQFKMNEDDAAAAVEAFGEDVVPESFRVFRTYAKPAELQIDVDVVYSAFLKPFMATLPDKLRKALGTPATTSDLRTALAGAGDAASENPADVALASDAASAIAALDARLGTGVALLTAVRTFLRERLPRTFYFSNYSQLRGRYELETVFEAVQEGSDEDEIQAAADFLTLARVVPATIEDWNYEKSNSELEAVSSLLTARVRKHWKQNDHLKLKVSLEAQQQNTASGNRIRRYLQFRVEDTRHDFTNRLDRRSTGFRWFVSFMASFLEFEKDQRLILLLDEPGLSLHARAQMNLLDTMEGDLAAQRQVLYSTHSPFMVRTNALAGVRIVEDRGPEQGSSVINDAGVVSDADTLFPLQAALGYDVAQSLFIGTRNILVEGISDLMYLTALSDHLSSLGRSALPTDCRLLPAGGATNIPTFLALLGAQLDIVVLVDGNTSDQRIKNSIEQGRLKESRIISLDAYSSVTGADIEDLFDADEYLALYNGALGAQLKLSDLKGQDRIVQRIARKAGDFNHGVVAAYFLRNLDATLTALSEETLQRFEKVIVDLIKALPEPTAETT
jgi:predicted ATP-dependent endonuclease of OLD family